MKTPFTKKMGSRSGQNDNFNPRYWLAGTVSEFRQAGWENRRQPSEGSSEDLYWTDLPMIFRLQQGEAVVGVNKNVKKIAEARKVAVRTEKASSENSYCEAKA
ncbi:hypothetical protein Peur_017884 [Populus x canadensis]